MKIGNYTLALDASAPVVQPLDGVLVSVPLGFLEAVAEACSGMSSFFLSDDRVRELQREGFDAFNAPVITPCPYKRDSPQFNPFYAGWRMARIGGARP